MFWLFCLVLTLVVLAKVLTPILQPSIVPDANPNVALYKAQLAEVERDLSRGVIAAEEAERTQTEVARRLLAANKALTVYSESPKSRLYVGGLAVCTVVLAFAIYWDIGAPGSADMPLKLRHAEAQTARTNRPSQAEAESEVPVSAVPEMPKDYLASVERLRNIMPKRPEDLQGWELLAYHEARMRNLPAAAKAQARVIEIKGTDAEASDYIRHADLLVAAADGYVSPEAEARAQQALALDPNNVAARYYLGAMFDQTGRPDMTFQIWRPILEGGAAEGPYVSLIRAQISRAAFFAGIDYTPPAAPQMAALPGPNAEQMAAASEMDVDARNQMIAGMVEGLAERMATDGGTVAEWARLITAYSVLGRSDESMAILEEARVAFASSPDAIAVLEDAASQAGLSQ